ncbi:MAG TPA: hypothetical protein VGL08_06245 [Paraburkholderia sp.]|jgi:hypothetical protein
MPSDHIKIADDSTVQPPCYGTMAAPSSDASPARAPAPVGLFTLGIAWLFGLEALLADERRR